MPSEMPSLNCRTESLLLSSLMLLGIVTVFLSSSPIGTSVERLGDNMVNLAAPHVSGSQRLRTISDQVAIEAPVIQGWGGVTLDEASTVQMQSTLQRLNKSGYNAVRVGFTASITPCSSGELGYWRSAWLIQLIQLAQHANVGAKHASRRY